MLLDTDLTRLRHIVESSQEAIGYAQGLTRAEFETQRPLQHSVVRCIEIIGEASCRLSDNLRKSNPQIPWVDIISMRNRIVHAYFDIDVDVVWKTAIEDLPFLLIQIEDIIKKYD